jgi:hypothetical protein
MQFQPMLAVWASTLTPPCGRQRAEHAARPQAAASAELRPTFTTQNRVSTWDVAGVLGTSEAVIRKTYGHHSVEHLRRAVDVWSKRPAKATG